MVNFSNYAYKSRLLAWAKTANKGVLMDWTEQEALAVLRKHNLLSRFYEAFPNYDPSSKA